ncbi:MAG: hypothetical protein WBV11_15660 [Salegentibacter sp.]
MALTNCKECGNQLSTKAEKCPHCGAKVKKGNNSGLITVLIVIMLFIGFSMFIPDSPSDSSSSTSISHPNNFLAYSYAEDAVKKHLKSPSTAKFPGTIEKNEHVQYLGNGEYQIHSWVDSQNSFGAMLRSNFSVIIEFDGNNVRYKNLEIN